MAGALPNVRHCHSLVDQVELRRAIFHEGRAQLRQQRCHSCPLDRFKLAAHAVLRGTHVVLLQNEVVTIWTEASGHGKKQLEDTFQDSGMEPASMTNDVDTLQKPGDVDTMLVEFEIMSSHLPGLKDSKDFQKDAQRLTSMVHSSISTLLNMHDSASAGLDDLSALRMQFTEQVTRAQELWNSIKDDVIRIQILLGQCSEPSVTQQPPKVRPPAFIKIVEHSLESLGAFKDVCAKRSAPKDDCMNSSSSQDAELFAALGGGTYQRLVDWGDHWDTLRRRPVHSNLQPEDSDELGDHLLKFLDECRDTSGSKDSLPNVLEEDTEPAHRVIQLTSEHTITSKRFNRNQPNSSDVSLERQQTLASPQAESHLVVGDLSVTQTDPASLRTRSPDSESTASCEMKLDTDSVLSEIAAQSCASSKLRAASPRRVHFNSRRAGSKTRATVPTAHIDECPGLAAAQPFGSQRLQQVANKSLRADVEEDDSSCVLSSSRHSSSVNPNAIQSPRQSIRSDDSDIAKSSEGESSSSGRSVVSQRGRHFYVTGHSLSKVASPLMPKPPTEPNVLSQGESPLNGHDEETDIPLRRKSLPAVHTVTRASSIDFDVDDIEAACRKKCFEVRGRSLSVSSVGTSPPLEDCVRHELKAALSAALNQSRSDDEFSIPSTGASSTATSRASSKSSSRSSSKSRATAPSRTTSQSKATYTTASSIMPAMLPAVLLTSPRSPANVSTSLEGSQKNQATAGKWASVKKRLSLPAIVDRITSMKPAACR